MKNLFKNCQSLRGAAAFTLAEVLITLGIIGVVAAITIPNLVTNYQKKQTAIHLKKVYSELSQALYMVQVTNGSMDKWDFANYTDELSRTTDFFENYLIPNLKIVKKCIPSNSECWADTTYNLDKVALTSARQKNSGGLSVSFLTQSGYSVLGWLHANGTGGWFYVDLNGPKTRPNQLGKDIFVFTTNWKPTDNLKFGLFPAGFHVKDGVTRDNLINSPTSVSGYSATGMCEKNNNHSSAGLYCGAVIMLDDWEIKDDYPW